MITTRNRKRNNELNNQVDAFFLMNSIEFTGEGSILLKIARNMVE